VARFTQYIDVVIKVDGREVDLTPETSPLISVRVEEAVNLPDTCAIRIADPHFSAFGSGMFRIGSAVEVALQGMVVFRGEVTTMVVDQAPGNRHEFVVQGLDLTHRLNRGPRTRTYEQMTDADIVAKIAADHGLDTDIESTREVHPYVIQANESDFQFLGRRAKRIGYEAWVSAGTLHFRSKPEMRGTNYTRSIEWGDEMSGFRVRFSSADRVDSVVVRGWDPKEKKTVVGRATRGEATSTAPAAKRNANDARSAFGSAERVAADLPVFSQTEADAAAASLMAKAGSGDITARFDVHGDPAIGAGTWIELSGAGADLSGEYLVTAVTHLVDASGYSSRIVAGPRDSARFADFIAPSSTRLDPSSWGSLVYGIVSDVDDPEALGRVKVQFPDLGDTVSYWAPVIIPGGGNERGLYALPEVGDQVVVGFEHDDTRRPMVLGSVFNAKDKPPSNAVEGGKVVHRTWKSRNGHQLDFVDDDPGTITLSMGDAAPKLELTKAKSVLIGEDKLEVSAREIVLSADTKLVIEAGTIEINGSQGVKIDGARIDLG